MSRHKRATISIVTDDDSDDDDFDTCMEPPPGYIEDGRVFPYYNGPYLFDSIDVRDRLGKTVMLTGFDRQVPVGSIGTVVDTPLGVSSRHFNGEGAFVEVGWKTPIREIRRLYDSVEYAGLFELPLNYDDTVEAMYLALELRRHFSLDHLQNIASQIRTARAQTLPDELTYLEAQYPQPALVLRLLPVACDVASILAPDTEENWTLIMADVLMETMTMTQIEQYCEDMQEEEEAGSLPPAKLRITIAACKLLLGRDKPIH